MVKVGTENQIEEETEGRPKRMAKAKVGKENQMERTMEEEERRKT